MGSINRKKCHSVFLFLLRVLPVCSLGWVISVLFYIYIPLRTTTTLHIFRRYTAPFFYIAIVIGKNAYRNAYGGWKRGQATHLLPSLCRRFYFYFLYGKKKLTRIGSGTAGVVHAMLS